MVFSLLHLWENWSFSIICLIPHTACISMDTTQYCFIVYVTTVICAANAQFDEIMLSYMNIKHNLLTTWNVNFCNLNISNFTWNRSYIGSVYRSMYNIIQTKYKKSDRIQDKEMLFIVLGNGKWKYGFTTFLATCEHPTLLER